MNTAFSLFRTKKAVFLIAIAVLFLFIPRLPYINLLDINPAGLFACLWVFVLLLYHPKDSVLVLLNLLSILLIGFIHLLHLEFLDEYEGVFFFFTIIYMCLGYLIHGHHES